MSLIVFKKEETTQYPSDIPAQINRMFYFTVSKASQWALTVNYDWTNVQEITELDPQYTIGSSSIRRLEIF